ncbi:CinA family protein [Paraoerskovia marina]|uniref:CinA family protein n=1 Tax=Paraoerskovia marina TaxID=545619 RepID=UPI000B28ECFD|nr:nicotinamide-nucleotide amidohydrolase family protein [Paraoerskovia marina]
MIDPRARQVVELCAEHGLTVGTAESLTGGLVAATLVDVPGASAVFRGSVVSYATDLKVTLLGVDRHEIDRSGVVSAAVATAMSAGARSALSVDVALATTGVAGPGAHGGVAAGTVVVAAQVGEIARTRTLALPGDRSAVRSSTVGEVLGLCVEILRERR